eukprot:236304-Pleurochrysis_carterae.AAC.2
MPKNPICISILLAYPYQTGCTSTRHHGKSREVRIQPEKCCCLFCLSENAEMGSASLVKAFGNLKQAPSAEVQVLARDDRS